MLDPVHSTIPWAKQVLKGFTGTLGISHVITYGYSINGSSRLQGFNVVDVWRSMWRRSIHREICEIDSELGGDHVDAGLMFQFHIDRSSVIVCRPRCVQLPFWQFSAAHDRQMDMLTVQPSKLYVHVLFSCAFLAVWNNLSRILLNLAPVVFMQT